MGWDFQWQQVDRIAAHQPRTLLLPVVLCCPYERCIERARHRHRANPEYCDAPDVYKTDRSLRVWEFLARLDRPDVHFVDADRPHDAVYAAVLEYVSCQLEPGLNG